LGFRNANNEPDGFDIAYCKDMAKYLGVEPTLVQINSQDRFPSLMSNRIDVLIGPTATPQRALSASFSQPYVMWSDVVLTRDDTNIKTYDEMKGRSVGGVTGTTTEQELQVSFKEWNDPKGSYTGYATDAESYLALSQGKIDAMLVGGAIAAALIKSRQFPNFVISGNAPFPPDAGSIAVRRNDIEFLNWVKLFVYTQVRLGRYQVLWNEYFADGEAPALDYVKANF
jgi:polar amino acid transport system substrate-binding protein